MRKIEYNPGTELTLYDIRMLISGETQLSLSTETLQKMQHCYDFLKGFMADKVIYGINTGFGPMAQYRIDDDSLKQLQYNIIRSHATGAGKPLPEVYVKAAMIARLFTFMQGYSGVHPDLAKLLLEFINRGIYPYVPEHGSVGASGDLVQLAHIALALIGEGEVSYKGNLRDTASVLRENGLEPFKMHIREGLSATNGTSVMTGIGLVNLVNTWQLISWASMASSMVNEIASSYDDFLTPNLHILKGHFGQMYIASAMLKQLRGSKAMRKRENEMYVPHKEQVFDHKVQPYYSLRCVPQILGPVFDELLNAKKVLFMELNGVDDNPIVDPILKDVYHGGNFHGDYVSYEMDKLKIGITKLVMLMERQLNYLCHDRINGILPPFVNMGVLGLNYGMQGMQFTATSTTAECQTLSNPMSIHSIPNNNDNQDIVSMGTNSALMAATVIENAYQVMAIHFMAIVQAVDCLEMVDKLSPQTRDIYNEIRSFFPTFVEDTPKYREIDQMITYLKQKDFNAHLRP